MNCDKHILCSPLNRRDPTPAFVLLCLLLAFALHDLPTPPTFAQQNISSATLSGQVLDEKGSCICGAVITVVNRDTRRSETVVTNDEGRYKLSFLPVGSYQLLAECNGFTTLNQPLTLTVGQSLDIPITLTVAGVAASISVNTDAPIIETPRTQVAETILPLEIDSLPLNGRNYLDLAALTPAVTRSNPVANQRFPETSAVPGTGLSITGQRSINNGFVVDGMSANDDAADLPGTFFSQEVIREFAVISSGGIAQFGRASAGFINIITQSGTNNYRGRAYGFFRNRRFDARNPLAPQKDPFTQAQYGISVGGPIVANRTFFFTNYEETRLHNAAVVTIANKNVAAINQHLASLGYASPHISTGIAPTGFDAANFLLRLDHQINASHQLNARHSVYHIDSENSRNVGGLNAVSRGTALNNSDQSIVVSEIASLSPTTLNEFRFQYIHSRLKAPVNDDTGPAVNIAGVANFGTATFSPTERNLGTFEFVETLTTGRVAHSLKMGGTYLLNRVSIDFPGAVQGVYSFSSLTNFRANRYTTFQQAFGTTTQYQSNPNLGLFVQDEWRPRAGLTINAGLRYDAQYLSQPITTDTNNFAPRFGVAYAPGNRKTVVRASFGIFFDRIPLRATSNALQRDGRKYRVAVLSFGQPGAPAFPDTLPTFPTNLLVSVTAIDPEIKNAYSQQASAQIEREISAATSLSIGFLHTRGLHLILSRNINVPTSPAAAGVFNLGRPDPRFANVSQFESAGESSYNAMTVSLNRRFQKWFGFRLSYTLSKAEDDAGNAFFFAPQDNFKLRDEWGRSDMDQPHVLALSGTFQAPTTTSNRLPNRLLSETEFSYIFRYSSSLPFNILTGNDRNFDTNPNDRPVGVGRNSGKGFDFASLDLRLSKSFRMTEKLRVDAILEAFNVLNRANLQLPNNVYGTGTSPLPSFGQPTSAADPRQIQFGLRISFE
jgi:Carboxypeptidase regulatory-like domain/TonB dependent receptor